MSKFAGFIIGAIEIGIGIATGNVALIVSGGAMILSQAIVDLTAPKQPAREASEMTIALGEQPRVMLIGETFTPGSLVDGFDYGGKYGTDWEVQVIRLADHKCHSLTGFFVNDDYNLYTADGLVPAYGDQLKIYFRPDTSTNPLPAIVTANGPGWTADDIGRSGCDVIVAYKADKQNAKKPVWPGGRPRFGFVLKGKLHYDPRKDSTVPGGAGAHRWLDASTWEWSENPIVCRYNWVRGVFAEDDVSDATKLLVGRGLTAVEAPPENIFAAANLCDELAGSLYPLYARDTVMGNGTAFVVSDDSRYMAYAAVGGFEYWDLPTRTKLGVGGIGNVYAHNYDIAPDGTVFYTALYLVGVSLQAALYTTPLGGATTKVDIPSNSYGLTRVFDIDGVRTILTTQLGGAYYLNGVGQVVVAHSPRDSFRKGDGTLWTVTQPTGSSNLLGLMDVATGTVHAFAGLVTRSDVTIAQACHVASAGHFFIVSDGKYYIVDDATFTVLASGAQAWGSSAQLPVKNPAATVFWDVGSGGASAYSLLDASLLRTETGWGIVEYRWVFDPFNYAIIARQQFVAQLDWLLLDRHGGYRVAGPIYANQQFIDVEQMFVAATAGDLVTREGSVELEPGQAKSVVATITDDDLVVGSKVSWNRGFLSQADGGWLNTVVANYIEPDQNWNPHDAPVVRNTADIVADGKARETTLTQRLVRYQAQALRLAEIARRKGRLWGRGAITLGPRFCELEDGDWIQWTSSRFGGASKTFRIEAYLLDEKWQNTLTLVEMSSEAFAADGIFSFDLAVPTTTVSPPAIGTPTVGNWALAATTLTSSGASIPALEVTGTAADDDKAQAIIVEYWKSDGVTDPTVNPDAIPWTMFGRFSPDTAKVDITSVTGGAVYYTAVSYVVDGIPGDRLVEGPATVGTLAANPPTSSLTASEAIAAASFVNIYSSSGAKVRNANATNDSKPVNGFAAAAIGNGATGAVQGPGCKLSGLSGLTPGATYYLDTAPGAITITPPSASGNLVQELGVAVSATELLFNPKLGTTL